MHHQTGNSKIISIIFTARFLVHALMEDQFRSEFYLEDAPKGIRSTRFYITDVTECPTLRGLIFAWT